MQSPHIVHKNIAYKQIPCSSNNCLYSESNIPRMNKTNAVTTLWPAFVTAYHFVSIMLMKFVLLATYRIKYNVHTFILIILILIHCTGLVKPLM